MSVAPPPLSPYKRELLLDALRPPAGFSLDRAVGTSFSLDLMSALVVPLSFAMFDVESGDAGADPTAVLAAAQTQAERIALYCEAGRIAASAQAPSALAYLERSVHTVRPPRRGSFHPKLWVLRFANNEDPKFTNHRVLCSSRNLTLDTSWDTILTLEEGPRVRGQTEPLARFLEHLDRLSPSDHAKNLARTVQRVSFAPPAGFDRVQFLPVGALGAADPLSQGGDRLFVLSPFLDANRLGALADAWDRVDVASRGDALDRLPLAVLERFRSRWVFDSLERANQSGTESVDLLPVPDERVGESLGLSGLHAKVHCGSRGDDAFLLVGSANATTAGFERNVEFCVELRGPQHRIGPAVLLRERKDKSGLRALLGPYTLRDEPSEPSAEEQELERLDEIRRELAQIPLAATVRKRGPEGPWALSLKATRPLPKLKPGDSLTCWPVTRPEGTGARVTGPRKLATFNFNSLANVTGYFSFSLSTRMRGVPDVRFTVDARLTGDIEDRLDRILGDVLRDPQKFIRFLLLLLAAGQADEVPGLMPPTGNGPHYSPGDGVARLETQVPLLEVLVRTFARDPARLSAFQNAIRHVRSAKDKGIEVPDGLLEIWEPVEKALRARIPKPRKVR